MPSRVFVTLAALAVALPLHAAEPDTARGDKIRDAFLRAQVERIEKESLAGITTKADWEAKRPEYHRQFLDMLGLWPLPPRTDLKPTVTGKVEAEHFTVEKLHFQSMPGLYVTANLYVPKKLAKPAPAVLYVCGHGNTVVDKVSYGSKVNYQHHPAWFAENGYVCIILDTLQLGEIEGTHHGLHRFGMWWWLTKGYTPAGIECWNGMRAIDYLISRKEVDPKRIGVTGRSGGGATSWWVMAADDRVQCAVPVAGLADMRAHLIEGAAARFKDGGVLPGHCDCMYFLNTYRWDFDRVIALCAPRPVLLGNSDVDDIFPVEGYRRPAAKARKVYELYGAGDKFDLLETKGPHKDTPELRAGAFAWMNRWLKGGRGEVKDPERPRFEPKQLKVFEALPADQLNTRIHEVYRKPAGVEIPASAEVAREWWKGKQPELTDQLRARAFRNWPSKAPDLKAKAAEDVTHDGVRLRAFDFVSEEEVPLRLWLMTAEKTDKPALVVLNVLDEDGWKEWCGDLGKGFGKVLHLPADAERDAKRFEQNRRAMETNKWAFAAVAPRGVGPTRWSDASRFDGKPAGQHVRRRLVQVGRTLDDCRVWDARRGVAVLRSAAELKDAPLWLQGKGEMAGVALYAGVFEPDVARLDLWHPPASHQQGPTFLHVREVLDVPQAMALAFPKKVRVYVKDDEEAKAWDWPLQLQKALGQEYLQIRKVGD